SAPPAPRSISRWASWKAPAPSTGRSTACSAIRSSSPRSPGRTMFERLAGLRASRAPLAAGVLMLGLCLVAAGLMPPEWRESLREDALDLVLAVDQRIRRPPRNGPKVVVIDIDRRSVEALGPWPWPRETMARLMQAIAAAHPAATAVDILFAEADERSPAALARKLGSLVDRADLTALAESLPDRDKRLAEALRQMPTARGFVLDPA